MLWRLVAYRPPVFWEGHVKKNHFIMTQALGIILMSNMLNDLQESVWLEPIYGE